MEFIKQNKMLVVGGVISFVLLLVAGVFLFLNLRQYSADTAEADENQNRLTQLENRQPGPTPENVQIVASNAVIQEKSLAKLLAELRRGQLEPVNKPRSVFNSFLKSTIDQMNKSAEKQKMLLPAKFDYGFRTYVEGQLPATQDVARLTVQVQMVRGLLDALLAARAAEIVSIERQVFEEGVAATSTVGGTVEGRGEGRGAGVQPATVPSAVLYSLEPPDAQGLYTREHFTLTLRMSDERLAMLMNILARDVASNTQRLFTVVSRLNIVSVGLPKAGLAAEAEPAARTERSPASPASVVETAQSAEGAAASVEKPALPKAREERIVAGTDYITVQMDVDVYRFAAVAAKEKVKL